MDRQTALDILEAARPDSGDRNEPELAEAAAWLDAHPECARIVERRQALDREIGRAMREVPVPAGLKQQLLASLAAADAPADKAAGSAPSAESPAMHGPGAWVRRTMAAAAVVAALLVVAIGLLQFAGNHRAEFSLIDLHQVAQSDFANLAELDEFDGDFSPALPSAAGRIRLLNLSSPPRGLEADHRGKHRMALYSFSVPLSRRPAIEGALLVVPARRVEQPPAAASFFDGTAAYVQSLHAGYQAVAWTEGELVYVLFVPAAGDHLDTLRRALEIAPA